MDELERCVLVKPEVFMFKIPPRQSARGYRAADWNLAAPDWTGRLRCMVRGNLMTLRLEDRGSGELFAACPVEQFPGMSVEPVTDSSRYFVICIKDDTSRKAYIGIGFSDRSDSFDLNVALQDHFKQIKKEEAFSKETDGSPEGEAASKPKLDLAFKEGQTIRVSLNVNHATKKDKAASRSVGGLILPPPPGASTLATSRPAVASPADEGRSDALLDLDPLATTPTSSSTLSGASQSIFAPDPNDPWGDFTSAPSNSKLQSGSWEQF